MILQNIYLDKWRWYIRVFYDISSDEIEDVLDELIGDGCPERLVYELRRVIRSKNTGFTYTDMKHRFSDLIIRKTTSSKEFRNTLDHEKLHLILHIAEANNISLHSEDFTYLCGELGEQMHPISKKFICDK